MKILKDNHGWGLSEMLLLTSIIILTFITVCFMIYKTLSFLDTLGYQVNIRDKSYKSSNKISYIKLENKLLDKTIDYIKDNKIKIDGNMYISIETLEKNHYIDVMPKCSGYVKITKETKTPYIKCPYYITPGYSNNK